MLVDTHTAVKNVWWHQTCTCWQLSCSPSHTHRCPSRESVGGSAVQGKKHQLWGRQTQSWHLFLGWSQANHSNTAEPPFFSFVKQRKNRVYQDNMLLGLKIIICVRYMYIWYIFPLRTMNQY